jgi:diguanylate cyclase (GGDEF)-like protein
MPAAVTLVRSVMAIRDASADQWTTMLSLPSAGAGVVITVGVAWRLARLVREREQAHRMLMHRSRHDDLTGLPNRAFLLERLREAIERQQARPADSTGGFGLMFLDLDGFKSINDNYGHQAGDVVLIDVARRLAGAVRTDDLVGRMAGDEFVLLCGEPSDEASLRRLADRVRATVEAPMPVEFGVVTPRVSIGVIVVDHALASADDAVSTILRAVDARMYVSKRAARKAAAATADRRDRGRPRARDEAT